MRITELISVHDLKKKMCKNYYGSSKKVMRTSDVQMLLDIWSSILYLSELSTRTKLVPCNEEFLNNKAIPHYNEAVKRIQKQHPFIKEIQRHKVINHSPC